jgi:transcriptional regulator with XRE-family HTH domain
MKDTLGDTLKFLRERKKLTLKETADSLGIDWSMLARIEKGQRSVNEVLFKRLADLFEVEEQMLRTHALADKVYKDVCEVDYAEQVLKIVQNKIKEKNQ